MKKIAIILFSTTFLFNCGGGGYNSGDTTGFIHEPTMEKFDNPNKSYNLTWTGSVPISNCLSAIGCYAIIYQGNINNQDYAGIAISDDPSNETFNLKLSFLSSTLSSNTLDFSDSNTSLTVKVNGCTYNAGSGTTNITLIDNSDGTYNIDFSPAVTVSSTDTSCDNSPDPTILATSITAKKYPD